MLNVIKITIDEFKRDIYKRYIKLFPVDEQRDWNNIEDSYKNNIENFYKIVLNNETIGFFMLERLNDNYPYYLEYFAIYEEFQSNNYGKEAINYLLNKIILNSGLVGEIEKVDENNPVTKRRLDFYKRLGFKEIGSEYLLYGVYYIPLVYLNNKKIDKDEMDKILFDYYKTNVGEKALKKKCRIIK